MAMNDSTKEPLVSVIISSYNHFSYVEESVLSVLNQTYKNIELLVVDDGSVDGSAELLSTLSRKYGFFFKAQRNQGLSRTLNETIAISRGEFIAPFGSDDIMLPERITRQVEYMKSRPSVGVCAGAVQSIDSAGNLRGIAKHVNYRVLDFDDIFLAKKRGAPAPTLLFRREAFTRAGGFDPEIRLEDLYILLRVTELGYSVDVLGEVLALYRSHADNTSKNHRFMVENVLKIYSRYSDRKEHASVCARYLNSMFLRCSKEDNAYATELLKKIPLRHWNRKTINGVLKLLF